jgi:pimeloyl-ACP methyl ester carboxylesterase
VVGGRGGAGVGRRLRRAARVGLALVASIALVLAAFRVRAFFRETEQLHVPPRSGRFVRTPLGELRYQERGGRSGRPVVFIGGTMAPSDALVPLMDELCDERLRCMALDLPPFGYSERPPDADYGRERQAARIDAFLRSVGVQGAVLVGHSFGAGPTVETAMRSPDDVSTFALIDGALGLGSGPPSAVLRAALALSPLRTALASATFANPWLIRASLRKFIADEALVTEALVERFAAPTRVKGMARATGRWAQTAFFADESRSLSGQRSSYRQYTPAVLLIWGDEDVATPLAQAQELAALLPHAQLAVISSANHFPHLEAQSRVVAALRPFLLAR